MLYTHIVSTTRDEKARAEHIVAGLLKNHSKKAINMTNQKPMSTQDSAPLEIMSLSEFIKENRDLLTVINISIAVTAFTARIANNRYSYLLSCLFMMIAITTGIELLRVILRRVERPGFLFLFFSVNILLAVIFLIMFVVESYYLTLRYFYPIPLSTIIFVSIIKRYVPKGFKALDAKHKIYITLLFVVFLIFNGFLILPPKPPHPPYTPPQVFTK